MKLLRAAAAGALSLGFIAAGLWVVGGATRVSALVRTAVSAPEIEALSGSHLATPHTIVLDGVPARVRRCTAPAGTTLGALREHFDAIADRECDLGGGRKLPHTSEDHGEVAYVLWTTPRDGHRKGVIAQREAGLIRYTLVDGDPLPGTTPSGGAPERVYLPGGLVAPAGSRGSFSLEDGNQGYAFFESSGSSDTVAAQLRASLAQGSYEVDSKVQTELDAAREAAPRTGSAPVVISFQGKDRKGYFVVSPARPGTSRVTLALR